MSAHRTTLAANLPRIASGLLSLALLGALLLSVVRGHGSTADAEAAAQERAVRWASTALSDALEPEQVSSEILGPAYRELLIVVQARILADDRVARVRIWSPQGLLVFSSDQRDKIGEYVAEGDPHIEAALGGEVVSLPTEATLGPKAGLAGADEKLFQTFVPLHLAGETSTSGVVQIDQRYQAIEDEAAGSWASARLALVAALTASVLWFLFTMRRRPTPAAVAVGGGPATESVGAEDVAAALARAERAEAEAATAGERVRQLEARVLEAEERAARAEAELAEALARGPEVGAAEVGVAQELEEERQRLAGELARMRAALAEREAELALARESHPAAGAEAGADRIAELEAELERTRAELEAAVERVEAGAAAAEAARAEAASVRAELETTRAELETTRSELETTRSELETTRSELETTRSELETTRSELAQVRAASESLEAGAAEGSAALRAAEERASAAEAEGRELASRVEALAAELETTRAELRTAQADLEEARAQLSAGVSAAAEEPTEDVEALRARIEELEAARRNDIAELQRAQEALANTQYEAAQAIRTAKELERELAVLRAEAREAPAAGEPEEERPTIGERLATLARERAAPARPSAEPETAAEEREPAAEAEPATQAETAAEEGLSLRERLARAAAARHRAPGKDTEPER